MFSYLARHPKPIAWFFTGLFYSHALLLAVSAQAATGGYAESITKRMSRNRTANGNRNIVFNDPLRSVIKKDVPQPDSKGHTTRKKNTAGTIPLSSQKKFTTGPTQPEMQSFQSVNANNMVDLFSGDFSYNIPLLDVGGYPVNLHYQSGISMDQEASWVGLGWNINPGTITRNMRGLPDDFKGDSDAVTKTVSMKSNRTFGLTIGIGSELFGGALKLGASYGILHNTYKGWGIETGINATLNSGIGSKGSLTSGLSITNNSQDGLGISPSLGFKMSKLETGTTGGITIGTNFNSRVGVQGLQISGQVRQHAYDYKKVANSLGSEVSSYISFAKPSYTPKIQHPFTSTQITYTLKGGSEITGLHPHTFYRGYASVQQIDVADQTQIIPAYGYLYYDKARGNQNVLLDFNREKETSFREKTPHIAVPIYTYDTYNISGEGTGGMFRPYRGDIGFVYDPAISTKSSSNSLSLEVGVPNLFHGGADFNTIYAVTKTNAWMGDNVMKDAVGFREKDSVFENVYFKNPGEKGSVNQSWLDAIGDENLVRVDLSPEAGQNVPVVTASQNISLFTRNQFIGKKTLKTNTLRLPRDKRTQVISYLTAGEAGYGGLEKTIRSYNLNSFPSTSCATNYIELPRVDPIKKAHHLSEITVLNADGRRYVYGIPLYNIKQRDVTMSTGISSDPASGLVTYEPLVDNSTKNNKGKEGYFNREELPPYSHSFLLSGILSPDYVDVTGDGITEDDNGDAIKFNYSRIYSADNPFQWRAPYQANQASYNDGLKTDNRDEKGTYSYGTREVWYLNSVESKTMIATFVLDTAVRKDAYGVSGENGGLNSAQRLYRLKKINLYTKADYLKNGAGAKPIKTVNFEYSYALCKKNPGSVADSGKLTLEKVWFTYNNNNKGKLNPYTFTYHANNPDYTNKSYDRWGNYKNPADNPGSGGQALSNADYPYSLQKGTKNAAGTAEYDTTKSATNAAAWTLSEIKLPSGGKIKVTYESDDYAYVQNKRAMQFFSLAGFGKLSTSAINDTKLFPNTGTDKGIDYPYVFINVPEQVTDSADLRRKYLEGVSKLYFKISVKMPADKWGSGNEMVPCYADIEGYGVKGPVTDKRIWIKLGAVKGTDYPLATAAIQFLRLNLPSKAYPYSEPGDNISLKAAIGMLGSVGGNIKNTINGFGKQARNNNWCNNVSLEKSFVRLNNPSFKKSGGGLRVKKVEIENYWDVMTGQQMKKDTFGQEYNYTTIIPVNGVPTRISSGVATYEPAIGNDENPFHVPFRLYTEKEGIMAPTDFVYVEEPFAETFFPSPMVGYSKVTVQTINKTKKSATGFEETEFYTSKEFPTIVELTPLDNDSKKSFNPKINNFFKINARNYVTLSQGFKVELNDMNGKLKSQSTFAQNDLKNPISYTFNYYRLQNDDAGQKKLSNTVAVIDSANGVINTSGQIGKEVEIMIDVREQISTTIGGSLEANLDGFFLGGIIPLPVIIPSVIPMPSRETNRYRSIAVLKIVNKYGLLDSVIHIEKGSRVATRNLLYDGETGDVLLSQTNNEFDDPVYNFSYPAHWAYSGMGLAYKNIGAVFSNVRFQQGRMYKQNGKDTFPVSKYFESGDELLCYAQHSRFPTGSDSCQEGFYMFTGLPNYKKIWAIDASKGKEGDKGLFFIDQDGKPYTANAFSVKVLRSGKRNMPGTPVGSITSLQNPVKLVSGVNRIVFDSTTGVIAAGAARFKDLWRVDSTSYAKDTVIIGTRRVDSGFVYLEAMEAYSLFNYKTKRGSRRLFDDKDYNAFEASSYDKGNNNADFERRSWLRFDIAAVIPKGAVIKSATLELKSHGLITHENSRASNSSYLQRGKGKWIGKMLPSSGGAAKDKLMDEYFKEYGLGAIDAVTRATIPATPLNQSSTADASIPVTSLTQAMVDDYYAKNYDASIMIKLVNPAGTQNGLWSRLAYSSAVLKAGSCRNSKAGCRPALIINYYMPCADSSKARYSDSSVAGYYCYSTPKDSFICKPNIVDSSVNPYRWGILGNWRMDRAYTYYDRRKESDPNVITNIRKDGEIKSFVPYWSFTSSTLAASTDSSRWVWNSEMTLFNKKGYEIENHDPLDRYNSGQYGYNQTLPVAVAQNSKNRNMMFDGFEDYDYRTDTCKRCPAPRFIDMTTGGGARVDTMSHTGSFSLRVNGSSNATVPVKIVSALTDLDTAKLSIDVDSVLRVDTVVTPAGTGLNGTYTYNFGRNTCRTAIDPVIDMNWQYGIPATGCPGDWFDIFWEGNVQPAYTDNYTFYTNSDDGAGLYINIGGVWKELIRQPSGPYRDGDGINDGPASNAVALKAGTLYPIRVYYRERKERAKIRLSWSSSRLARQTIPQVNLYPVGSTGSGTTQLVNRWCVRLISPKPIKITNNRFSPVAGTKVLVTAWVRESVVCTGSSYANVNMQVSFNAGSPALVTLTPKGNIIEGWQRIEDTLTIPGTATSMSVIMRATSTTAVFFDDIRIHPFNSNMKSFVYSPVNIRLMAELDENNYATFYEYDDDGTLIRVKKETERGIKTIKETRSALLKE